jgi:hypothetical protein
MGNQIYHDAPTRKKLSFLSLSQVNQYNEEVKLSSRGLSMKITIIYQGLSLSSLAAIR